MTVGSRLHALRSLLEGYTYRVDSEKELHKAIERVLREAGVPFIRERRISRRDQPDFLLQDDIALEAKIQGSATELMRQIARYASHPKVAGILAVSTRRLHKQMPDQLSGKPIVFTLARRFL